MADSNLVPTFSRTLAAFIKDNFGIDDADALSDEEWHELFEKVACIEVDELDKAADENRPLSRYGELAMSCVDAMSNPSTKGGNRHRCKVT